MLVFFLQYKNCEEGCCEHEFCAYDRICYPKSKCRWGCPDGSCTDGRCLPQEPCKSSYQCEIGHTCTMNYNLGYNTCQYDLEIGNSLCVTKKRDLRTRAQMIRANFNRQWTLFLDYLSFFARLIIFSVDLTLKITVLLVNSRHMLGLHSCEFTYKWINIVP